jgi:hypothetical protein
MTCKAMMAAAVIATATLAPTAADAFCGFYVSGADASLFNDATQVVLMREGTRTVLTMQNAYKGPPSDFAMVVPVPVVLQKENVKTLAKEIFGRLDQLTAPRLVEYWEQDPCPPPMRPGIYPAPPSPKGAAMGSGGSARRASEPAVVIEAQFAVGEYEILILSARDSGGLDTWLRQNGYKIPAGAEPQLRPYVQMGMKFFVAKVDTKKVTFDAQGRAALSPLRFHYDTDAFHLPIRLGLINSAGTQDLIVTILAPGQRYEVSNYDNVAVPTNMDVAEAAKGQFGPFYAALFDQTLAKHPGSVVTEYSWQATSCDPCPVEPLTMGELFTLGADVLPSTQQKPQTQDESGPPRRRWRPSQSANFVLTRLHARYGANGAGNDLFFKAASPITGGREVEGDDGKLETGAKPASFNNFQGRYAVRHPWTGRIACAHPQRGIWGGPPSGDDPKPLAAKDIAFAPRGGVKLDALLKGAVADTMLGAAGPTPVISLPGAPDPDASAPGDSLDAAAPSLDASPSIPTNAPKSGCGACALGDGGASTGALLAGAATLATALARRIKRKR